MAMMHFPFLTKRLETARERWRWLENACRHDAGSLDVAQCIGLDDTHVKLIMPKEISKQAKGEYDPSTERLIEKMQEVIKANMDSLDAKMWGYSSFDPVAPYDLFDFRVSRHRDGPADFLKEYPGHVMADCYSGNRSVILAPESNMTRMACWSHARRCLHPATAPGSVRSHRIGSC